MPLSLEASIDEMSIDGTYHFMIISSFFFCSEDLDYPADTWHQNDIIMTCKPVGYEQLDGNALLGN